VPAKLRGAEGDVLLNLYVSILKAQRNFSIYPMDLDAYLPKRKQSRSERPPH
jgi:hypothetical protein